MKKVILVIISIFIISGCTPNYRELNELGIVTAFGITKEEDMIRLSIQLVNIMESGKNGLSESPITVISGKGKTIFDAARSLNLKSPKIFFLANVKYVIIDPSVLKSDLEEIIDYLTRDTKLSLNFIVITATNNDPEEILSSLSEFDINPATNLFEIITKGESRYGLAYSLTLKDFLNNFMNYGVEPLYPNVELTGDENKSDKTNNLEDSNAKDIIELKDLVFINSEKELVHLNEEEMYGFNFLNNNIKNAVVSTKCDGGYYTIETLKSEISLEDKLKKDKIKISGEVEAELVYYGCEEKFDNKKTLDKISDNTEKTIENYIKSSIIKAKENKTDFLGIGNWIYKNNTKYFDFEHKDWNKEGLDKIDFDFDINVNIYKQGNLRGEV